MLKSLLVWAQAESTSLHREEIAGLRKYPIAQCWDTILLDLTRLDREREGGSSLVADVRDEAVAAGSQTHTDMGSG